MGGDVDKSNDEDARVRHEGQLRVPVAELRRNLGLKIKAYNQEWQSYLSTLRGQDYDMARAGWVGDYQDPNTFLDMWVTGGGNNQTGFSNARYDQLIRAAADVERFAASSSAADMTRGRSSVDSGGRVWRASFRSPTTRQP